MEPCWRVAHFLFCILYDNFACLMFYFSNSLFPPWSFLDLDPNSNCQPGWPSSCLIFCFLKDKQVSYVTYLKKKCETPPYPFLYIDHVPLCFPWQKKEKRKKAILGCIISCFRNVNKFHLCLPCARCALGNSDNVTTHPHGNFQILLGSP